MSAQPRMLHPRQRRGSRDCAFIGGIAVVVGGGGVVVAVVKVEVIVGQ
jgi:hypothetical protein